MAYLPLQAYNSLQMDSIVKERMPEFYGGESALFQFLKENIKYPRKAIKEGIQGTIYVGFVIMEDGRVEDVYIKKGLPRGGWGLNAEALRVVQSMPNWIHGIQKGKPVKVAYTIPIHCYFTK